MSFEVIVIGWCAASLLAAGGLVVWFVVELRILGAAIWARRRRQRQRWYVFPRARTLDKRRGSRARGLVEAPGLEDR